MESTEVLPPPSPPSILIVEDRKEVLEVLRRTLAQNGYIVHTASDGEEGMQAALDLQPDLLILDIGLPKKSGLHVARDLRARAFRAPVLMLTALDSVTDKVVGLESGADDYLAKPFEYEELLARVRALLRRSTMRVEDINMQVADLHIDIIAREVSRDGELIALTKKEYSLLEYLMRHSGRIVTREQITEHVWKADLDTSSNVVDVYISYLRGKLDTPGRVPLLHTIRGVGYILTPDPPPQPPSR
jgi:DNA-binding response OmpR family regulator